jgi:hypothetical protein
VHARLLHLVQAHDGARQLALHRALVVDLLRELGHAEFAVVEKLEAHRPLQIDPLSHELQARLVHRLLVDQHRSAAVGETIGNLHAVQLGDDRRAVLRVETGEQNLVVIPHHPHQGEDEQDEDREQPRAQSQFRRRLQRAPPAFDVFPHIHLLDLHPQNVLIGFQRPVPYLHHQLQRQLRLFDRDHHFVKILRAAESQLPQLLVRREHLAVDLVDLGREPRGEIRARGSGRRGLRRDSSACTLAEGK